jgi:glycosyltransferase involved in cell wall biosynthesis
MSNDMPENPLLTIITVVYNSRNLIEDTLKSITLIKDNTIEYIVIDGGSTDGTVNIINNYLDTINVFVTEKDNGIYDAMNKGIALSHGKYISFLNAGDTYVSNFKSLIQEHFSFKYDAFSFGINYLYSDIGLIEQLPEQYTLNKFDPQFMYLPHPGLFAKRDLFVKFGLFNVYYKSSADLDWINRVITSKDLNFQIVKKPITNFLAGGMSSSYTAFSETKEIAIKYGKSKIKSNWIFFKQIILLSINKTFKIIKN